MDLNVSRSGAPVAQSTLNAERPEPQIPRDNGLCSGVRTRLLFTNYLCLWMIYLHTNYISWIIIQSPDRDLELFQESNINEQGGAFQ
jgi:hypothetical protein